MTLGPIFSYNSGVMEKTLALIVEDDKNLAYAFGEALREADYQTEILHDGREALQRLEGSIPSTIILDIHVPNVSGSEILKYIQSHERFRRTRVVILTADDRKAAELVNEADLVLVKPVGFRQLRDLAARLNPKNEDDYDTGAFRRPAKTS